MMDQCQIAPGGQRTNDCRRLTATSEDVAMKRRKQSQQLQRTYSQARQSSVFNDYYRRSIATVERLKYQDSLTTRRPTVSQETKHRRPTLIHNFTKY